MVDASNAVGSDLVVVLGDCFAAHRFVTEVVRHAAWGAELARLNEPLDVHAIPVNHDWWYGIAGVRPALTEVRIPVMENKAVLFGESGHRFLAGASATNWLILSGPVNAFAPTICPARSRMSPQTVRSSCWCTSPTSLRKCRSALR